MTAIVGLFTSQHRKKLEAPQTIPILTLKQSEQSPQSSHSTAWLITAGLIADPFMPFICGSKGRKRKGSPRNMAIAGEQAIAMLAKPENDQLFGTYTVRRSVAITNEYFFTLMEI